MKKPQKKHCENCEWGECDCVGYSDACDDWQKYYAWDIKTNYIRKSRLSVKRILGIIFPEIHRQFIKSGVKNVWLEQGDLARFLSNQLKKEKK